MKKISGKIFRVAHCQSQERLIRRTKAGQEAARARGRMGGRPKGLSPYYQQSTPMVISAYKQESSIREIMKAFKIPSTATVYKILNVGGIPQNKAKIEEK